MSFKKSILSSAIIVTLLSGCGGTGQDEGSGGSNIAIDFDGIAIDGQLARAQVYIDTNNNRQVDSWEPRAFTDNDGYFTFNPISETNYCSGAGANEDFCLRSNISLDNVILRIDGGYDRLTGEPFEGSLSTRVNVQNNESVEVQVVSPLTTLFEDVSGTDRAALEDALGITSADLATNYLADTDNDGEADVDNELLNLALKVHKVVTVLSDRLEDSYTEIGEEGDLPSDASSLVYNALAETVIASELTSIDLILESDTALVSVLNDAEDDIRSLYQAEDFEVPIDIVEPGVNTDNVARVLDIVTQIPDLVNAVIDPNASVGFSDATGAARAIEVVTKRALEEGQQSQDTSLDEAITLFTDTSNTLVEDILESMAQDNVDLGSLISDSFDFGAISTIEGFNANALLPDDAVPFSALPGKQLRLSEDIPDLENRVDGKLEDKEIEIYFTGEENATSGEFTACIKFIEDADSQGNTSDESTRGELVEGKWSLMDATGYSLLMVIEFLGDRYQAIIKPAGEDSENRKVFRSDYADDIADIPSEAGIVVTPDPSGIPTTDTQCREIFDDRLGIFSA